MWSEGCRHITGLPFLFLITVDAVIRSAQGTTLIGPTEYCNMEIFNATCNHDEVVFMTHARYGRMKQGRCVKRNLGYVGCAVDVMTYLDRICSGRKQCLMRVPDPVLHETQPCPEDTTPYLEASYQCVKVADGRDQMCSTGSPILLTGSTGFLSSSLSEETGYGTMSCPWKINVQPGQTINLTMYNFNRGAFSSPDSQDDDTEAWRPDVCYEYAILREKGHMKRITLCGGERRQSHLYRSRSNSVEIQIVNKQALKNLGALLIKYDGVGCPEPRPQAHGWVRRDGENAVIRCNHSNEVWYITCKDNTWNGNIGNCSRGPLTMGSIFSDQEGFPYGILIVVAIGVALGIFLGGLLLLLAVVYMKRRQQTQDANMNAMHYRDPLQERKIFAGMHSESLRDWEQSPKFSDSEDTLMRENMRIQTLPFSERDRGCLPETPDSSSPDRSGPCDPYSGRLQSFRSDPSKRHIYECPKFT